MIPYFVDTFYFLAMLNPRDEAYDRVVAFNTSMRNSLVTTPWVLTEVADAFAETPCRGLFYPFLQRFRSDPRVTITSVSDEVFARGIGLYNDRPDKQWSLTDCISFVTMTDLGLSAALTGDHHFEQAGFHPLLAAKKKIG